MAEKQSNYQIFYNVTLYRKLRNETWVIDRVIKVDFVYILGTKFEVEWVVDALQVKNDLIADKSSGVVNFGYRKI